MIELTTEDRERIEEWIEFYLSDVEDESFKTSVRADMYLCAEYATKYEREQQIKTLNRPGSKYYVSYDPDYKNKVFGVFNKEDLTQQGAEKMMRLLNELEAERSEVRNKVIEEAVDKLMEKKKHLHGNLYVNGSIDPFNNGCFWGTQESIEILNSLKK